MADLTVNPPSPPSLAERLFDAAIGTLELYAVYLGTRLGLYQTLRERGALTAGELADATGIAPRYAREWLEQQAVAGFLHVDGHDDPTRRRFHLPAAHVGTLCDEDDADHVAPFARMLVGIAGALPEVVGAYRSGGGVPYHRYGPDFCAGQGGINRPAFLRDLAGWIAAVPGLADRLRAGGRIVDVGCGEGWATIGAARAFPGARVIGIDDDARSIETASRHARAAGVDATFVRRDATALVDHGPFDLALVLETLHDLARPTETLAAIRAALAPGGVVIIADERVAETFAAPGDAIERMMYGWSVSHCLPTQMVEPGSAAIGTVIREDTVRALAAGAGFGEVEVLPIDNLLFRFYRLAR